MQVPISLNTRKHTTSRLLNNRHPGTNRREWEKPALGELKLNVDTASFDGYDFIGISGIIWDHIGSIRDHTTTVRATLTYKLARRFDPLTAELLAIREGVMFTQEARLAVDMTESDCRVQPYQLGDFHQLEWSRFFKSHY
ncbi:hypothetical protein PanWU01x14_098590 [Parasponia andersonii]|uniref:RNase H type-1 domain-containing protein n=1 Tax=Parasponia andersonii TaxID=3476 RepID=A0A2P5D483_PARAD|nr:hypothetical protein PanWU01x14_098590 [Parasponia andersonii]